jgi:hypothetical protein
VLTLALGFGGAVVVTASKRSASDRMLVMLTIGIFVILSLAPKQAARYLLPVMVLVCYMAGRAVAGFARRLPVDPALRTPVGLLLLTPLLCWQGTLCARQLRPFSNVTDPGILEFIRDNLPNGARILQDRYVDLPLGTISGRDGAEIEIAGRRLAAASSVQTIDEAIRSGFTHVAVCSSSYGRFYRSGMVPVQAMEAQYMQRRSFYDDLFQRGELLWHYTPPPHSMFSETGLYRLPAPDTPADQRHADQ